MYILCLIELWTRSPKTEVENVFLNVFAGFCKFGKVRKTEETLADFSENFNCLKKKIYHFAFALFSKDMLRIVKGFAPWILFDSFEEKFLYPLECQEVPSSS